MKMIKIKLKDIAEISAGQPAPKELDVNKKGIPFIRAGSLKKLIDGESLNTLEHVSNEVAKKYKLKLYSPETIFFAKSGMSATKNRIYMLEGLSYAVSHLAVLEPVKIESKYLVHALRYFSPTRLIKDMAYPSISLKAIANHSIFVPENLDDQIHIANLLSQVESLIAKREENIMLLDELLKSTFLDMFGDPRINNKSWSIARLGSLGNWKSGGTPLRKESHYYDGNIPWISSGELNKIFISSTKEHITHEAISNSNAKKIEEGSLLLGMYDTAALKSSITTVKASCNQAIAYAKLDDTLCNVFYIYHLIQVGKTYFKRQQRGIRQQNMNISMIKNMPIIMPPKPLQDKFATIVQQVEQTKEQHQKSLQELKNLFGSLSQRAFRGELD